MGTGYLTIQARTGDDSLPVRNAHVTLLNMNHSPLYETYTDADGNTETLPLPAPDKEYTLDPNFLKPAYSTWEVDVAAMGFVTVHIHGVEVVDTQVSILPVRMRPLADEQYPVKDIDIDIPPIALLDTSRNRQAEIPPEMPDATSGTQNPTPTGTNKAPVSATPVPISTNPMPVLTNPTPIATNPTPGVTIRPVIIPDYITVHLGTPTNASARNVRVRFTDYIKNVASSEIYSTWPQSSLESNIHVIVTFALNRVYTEWYRSRGYNFDITNSTSYDQAYRDGAQIFQNISRIVDGIFNVYARRQGFQNPFFTSFCNGTTVTCAGLSQWGTVTLANRGMSAIQILHYYYPNDIELIQSQNITGITESYPGYPLSLGSQGEPVRRMQNFLNRIRVNFPLIPAISNPNGVFGQDTRDAVRSFQRSFSLTADGIIGRSTWNKISFIYVGVARLAELDSEGERITISANPPNVVISQGSRGPYVLELQFILNSISPYYETIPTVIKDSVFGASVKNAVIEFQKNFNLTPDGVVGPATWNKLYSVYRGIKENAPVPPVETIPPSDAPVYPGTSLRVGSTGPNVRLMQTYLNTIRIVYPSIPYLTVNGTFDENMRKTVVAFQQEFLLAPDGVIGPVTWDKIVEMYMLVTGNTSVSLEYPGTPLRIGSTGSNVRLMQTFLKELRTPYPSLPAISVDGIFGPQTESAVIFFQRLFGLVPDGIIGPRTWYAIIEQRNAAV